MSETRTSVDVCLYDDSRPEYSSITRDGRGYIREFSEGGAFHLFGTRKGLVALQAAIGVALREMDAADGLVLDTDDGPLDLHNGPVPHPVQVS